MIKKARKPASPSVNLVNIPSGSDAELPPPSIPSPSIADAPDNDDSESILEAVGAHGSKSAASPSVPLPCGSSNPDKETPGNEEGVRIAGCERKEEIGETYGKEENGKEEMGEEEAGIAMLPMILSSCLVAIPITYLVWLPFLESI